MNKYQKAKIALENRGVRVFTAFEGVSVHGGTDSKGVQVWLEITEKEVGYWADEYDRLHNGYNVLCEIKAWADKQRDSDINNLSLQQLIQEFNKSQEQ